MRRPRKRLTRRVTRLGNRRVNSGGTLVPFDDREINLVDMGCEI
jgi:hypothetical protein